MVEVVVMDDSKASGQGRGGQGVDKAHRHVSVGKKIPLLHGGVKQGEHTHQHAVKHVSEIATADPAQCL